MQTRWWLGGVLVVILAYVFLGRGARETSEVVSAEETSGPSAPKLSLPSVAANSEQPKTVAIQNQKSSAPEPLPEHTVGFRVEEGLAIAHGDILIGKPEDGGLQQGLADVEPPQIWPDGIIPYTFAKDFQDPSRVRVAIEHFEKQTPIRFVPYRGEKDGVIFENAKEHCVSPLGKQGGLQPIRLAAQCETKQVLHEIMHSLGFVHEHQRRDRDAYLQVLWDNIDPNFISQFVLVPSDWADLAKGLPFDSESILLYSGEAFAKKKGLKSMESRTSQALRPAQTDLSRLDIEKVQHVYGDR